MLALNAVGLFTLFFSLAAVTAQSNELTKGVSRFANDLYEQCVKAKAGNVVISPFSIANSLALLAQATSASTFEELQFGLHLSGDKAEMANQFHDYFTQVRRSVGDATLSMASEIFYGNDSALNKELQKVAGTKFASGIESMDFSNANQSAERINQLVGDKTNERIKNFVAADSIAADTSVLLVNAIYFKSDWAVKFDEKKTADRQFHVNDNETVQTEFMYTKQYFNYVSYLGDLSAKAIELKYANSNISFLIVLPFSYSGLAKLEAQMKNYDLKNITTQMTRQKIDVYIPKFKVEYEIELNDVLRALGISKIFSTGGGLDGLLESGATLKVSKVIHKAFIEINEEGSELAAATATGAIKKTGPPTFRADHPFMYFIRDTESDCILFSGRFEKIETS